MALLLAFRMSDAHSKWQSAEYSAMELIFTARLTLSKACAYCVHAPAAEASLIQLYRLLVLAVIMMQKHIHGDRQFDEEVHPKPFWLSWRTELWG